MEERHAIEVTDLVISYRNLKKTSIKKNLLKFNRQKVEDFVAVKGFPSTYVKAKSWESSERTAAANPLP